MYTGTQMYICTGTKSTFFTGTASKSFVPVQYSHRYKMFYSGTGTNWFWYKIFHPCPPVLRVLQSNLYRMHKSVPIQNKLVVPILLGLFVPVNISVPLLFTTFCNGTYFHTGRIYVPSTKYPVPYRISAVWNKCEINVKQKHNVKIKMRHDLCMRWWLHLMTKSAI